MGTVYFAKWILLENGDILENGAVAVSENRILSAGPRGKARRGPDDRIVNLGDSFLLPGFINLHTHLEEGVIRGIQKSSDDTFAAWTAKKQTRLRQASTESIKTSIRLGVRELLAQGITSVVDNSRLGLSRSILEEESIRAWIIDELSPDDPLQEKEIINGAIKRCKEEKQLVGSGAGPYALYSLSPESQSELIKHKDKNTLWATHIAESAEELQAFSERKGDLFFQITRKRPWPYGDTTMGPMNYAINSHLIPDHALCFHCNYVNGSELEYLASINASVVLCYNYTREMGHKAFPLDVAMNRKVRICLGTEGVSPPGFMSLFEELYSLRSDYPHIPASEMIKWVTSNAAEALNMGDSLGTLSPGKLADLIAVRFAHDPDENPLEELLVEEPDIRLVVVDGEEVVVNY